MAKKPAQVPAEQADPEPLPEPVVPKAETASVPEPAKPAEAPVVEIPKPEVPSESVSNGVPFPGDTFDAPETPPAAEPEKPGPGKGGNQAGKKRGPYNREAPKEKKIFNPEAAHKAGEATGRLLVGLIAQFGGTDWAPQSDPERQAAEMAVQSTATYFVEAEIPDLPPGVALCLAWGMYVSVLTMAERNRPKVATLREKVAGWWAMRKARKAAKAAEAGK